MEDQTQDGGVQPGPAVGAPGAPVQSVPAVPAQRALYVVPGHGQRNFKWRWGFAAVLGAGAVALCTWALVTSAYTVGNRAVAAVGALLATAALAAVGNAVLLSYQEQVRPAGTLVRRHPCTPLSVPAGGSSSS